MPTLDGEKPGGEPELGLLATHFGGKTPLGERFRRAQLRAQMFGDPGETLTIGRYRVTGQIGAGAMGTVYRAVDPALDREVAVKILHRSDEVHRARMTIEAKALAKLSHPNVVTVHEVGTEEGQLFVAMELVQGKTLHAWLEDPSGPRLLEVFVQAAEGLQAAHDAGIVHRDFKPENVIVGDDGRVRVLDFGMARSPGAPLLQEVDGEAGEQPALEPAITRTGLLAGTPGYMAPEQFEGSRVDARADQFAFCIALHEAIWGRRPFRGETVAELAKAVLLGEAHLFEGRAREGLVPHEIDAAKAVIVRGLKTRPEERFDSMLELAGRLRGVPAIPQPQRPRARLFFGTLSAVTLGAGGLLFLSVQREPEAQPAGLEPVVAQFEEERCGLGTELRNGACVPLEWDPGLVKCDEGVCSVPRGYLVARDGEDAIVLQGFRSVPTADAEGNLLGVELFGVARGSVAHSVGLRSGDVVHEINGIALTSMEASMLLEEQLFKEKVDTLRISFERDGKSETVVVKLVD